MQYESKGDKILTLNEYLNLIEKYLKELIEEYKLKGEWKVQLKIEFNFRLLKHGSDETRIMYTRSDNVEKKFEFDAVNFLYYDFNKTNINRGGSYKDSLKWLKNKKSTVNCKNNDDKCFQYAVTLA